MQDVILRALFSANVATLIVTLWNIFHGEKHKFLYYLGYFLIVFFGVVIIEFLL